MNKRELLATAGVLLVLCGIGAAAGLTQSDAPLPPVISGVVVGTDGPLAGAIVQIQGAANQTQTAQDGAFTLTGVEGTPPLAVTAWAAGYYVGWATLDPGAPDWAGGEGITITLKPLPEKDNHEYAWFSFEGVEGTASCGLCHREYTEWLADAHSQAAVNPRFITMYTGTDVTGQPGQLTTWGSDGTALPPDPDKPYYGPGFRLDDPSRAGNCAACHTPVASKSPNLRNCGWLGCHTDLTIERANGIIEPHTLPLGLSGNAAEGITCDFCHKIGDVILDPETKLPPPDMPGILSYRLYRPDEGQEVFFGTVVDVTRRVSYLPLEAESAFCAPCHYGVFGGVVGVGTVTGGTLIYNSYGEWLDSPYSDPETGMTCQECHMPASDANWFVLPERGGLARDYATLHNHTMPGAADENLLQNSVTMTSSAQRSGDQLQVQISITNDKTGHHIPTDAPIRSMILVVEALDAAGAPLALHAGPVNPAYSGDYGGLPGKTFAKVLRDEWTGETPTGAYWRPVTIVEDTRLAALATDTTRYTFDAPAGAAVTVNVRLIFRRAFSALMKQKGWDDPDILMEHETIQVPAS
ncbi:MAG: carboxypeptidase regulatory-like domain-containing protein [Anaerolineae bacterium]|nr:carboxypeptidase regulatory-like domain-containing protein [Anaerolineae bacterium]